MFRTRVVTTYNITVRSLYSAVILLRAVSLFTRSRFYEVVVRLHYDPVGELYHDRVVKLYYVDVEAGRLDRARTPHRCWVGMGVQRPPAAGEGRAKRYQVGQGKIRGAPEGGGWVFDLGPRWGGWTIF